ncbi:MAG TPA: nitronate monooxygenase, partial [Rhizomicrobium sp.]|nr:nitronate monooxygenase [Rhizomicrobium sp.]
ARYGAEPPATIKEIYTSFVADTAMLDVFLQTRPAVVSFHFGLPSADVIARLKTTGIVLFSSATNLQEAQAAAKAGVDAIVAQGYEAGGHRGVFDPDAPDSRMRILPLTKLLVEKIALPVIAAGGIMDGADIAAALDAGAQAAQLGTAFVGCPESSADTYYRDAFFAPNATTEMTSLISGRPARCLQNKFIALKDAELKGLTIPDYPVTYDAGKALAIAAKAKGEGGFGAQWAGEGVVRARAMPAAELVKVLADELTAATGKAAAV